MDGKPIFLMSPPDYFNVSYIINPWMENQINLVNQALAKQQWQNFYNILQQYADIQLVPAHEGLPDLVFTANAGLAYKNLVILSHFRHKERQGEEPVFQSWFENNGFKVEVLPKNIYFEGAGDALWQPRQQRLWFSHGFRSDPQAEKFIKKFIDGEIISLELCDDRFYHLDTCLCPLPDETILYYPGAFSSHSQSKIKNVLPPEKRISVDETDATNFVCNCVLVDDEKRNNHKILIMNKISDSLQRQLNEQNYDIILCPMSEFLKSGGSTKCLSLQLNITT